ncbi:MAG: UDP-N-acetylmuramoyl-tripeptide--D-alanyl-D-alanine ligase [Candidatus Limnocylindrales bacterium]
MRDAPNSGTSAPDALDGPGIAAIAAGHLLRAAARPVFRAAVDSRRVEPGMLFVALPGEQTDGHRYLAEAARRGAAALLITQELPDADLDALCDAAPGGCSIVRVDDGLAALQALAAAWRSRFRPLVVGITGSVAKTSTKEASATVLSERLRVLRSEGNENNEIGLPLTLLGLERGHQAAVVEMGMYVPGEIAQLAAIARPRIGVVTAVRGIHLERAGSMDAIEEGKGQLVEALPPDGTAVLNADDPRVRRMDRRTRARVLRYGFADDADVTACEVVSRGLDGMAFELRLPDRAGLSVEIPALGRHEVQNGLAAAAVGLAAGLDADAIAAGLARGWRAAHRNTLLRVGPWLVIDDTYNAGPDSMAAALDLLATLPGRRVAVLGEMLELGPEAPVLHRAVGARAARCADLLLAVGEGGAPIAEGARAAGMSAGAVLAVPDIQAALETLLARLVPGDVVLCKASRGLGMDPQVRSARGLGLDDLVGALERAASAGGAGA